MHSCIRARAVRLSNCYRWSAAAVRDVVAALVRVGRRSCVCEPGARAECVRNIVHRALWTVFAPSVGLQERIAATVSFLWWFRANGHVANAAAGARRAAYWLVHRRLWIFPLRGKMASIGLPEPGPADEPHAVIRSVLPLQEMHAGLAACSCPQAVVDIRDGSRDWADRAASRARGGGLNRAVVHRRLWATACAQVGESSQSNGDARRAKASGRRSRHSGR